MTARLVRSYELRVYDAACLEPALRLQCLLATADARLATAAKACGLEVIWPNRDSAGAPPFRPKLSRRIARGEPGRFRRRMHFCGRDDWSTMRSIRLTGCISSESRTGVGYGAAITAGGHICRASGSGLMVVADVTARHFSAP